LGFQLLHVPGLYARFCIFPHNLAPDFPQYISGKEFEKMKTFIVYDLDSQMPVAVGEQVSAETARYCASVATGIFQANLLAEEIDLEKQITYRTAMSETSVKLFLASCMGNSSGDEARSQRLREAPFCFRIFLPATRSRTARRNFSRSAGLSCRV
jgi:hypothetical protein